MFEERRLPIPEVPVPKVDAAIIGQMTKAYAVPYKMITGRDLPSQYPDIIQQASNTCCQLLIFTEKAV